MLYASAGEDQDFQRKIFDETTSRKWGLRKMNSERDMWTRQSVNYQTTEDPESYGYAWVIPQAAVCENRYKSQRYARSDEVREYWNRGSAAPCTIVFAAGPNAGNAGRNGGSMKRTRNRKMANAQDYGLF